MSGRHSTKNPTTMRALGDYALVVIEPNRQMQNLLRGMLTAFGCRDVRMFGEIDSAVASMFSDLPDVLLMDWEAPPFGGRNLLKLIRHEKMFPLCLTPILTLLTVAVQKQVESAMRLGSQGVVVKPFSPHVLMAHINYVCATRNSLKLEGERYVVEGMAEQLDQESEKRRQLASARKYQLEQLEQLNSIQDDVDRILDTLF